MRQQHQRKSYKKQEEYYALVVICFLATTVLFIYHINFKNKTKVYFNSSASNVQFFHGPSRNFSVTVIRYDLKSISMRRENNFNYFLLFYWFSPGVLSKATDSVGGHPCHNQPFSNVRFQHTLCHGDAYTRRTAKSALQIAGIGKTCTLKSLYRI